MKKLLAADAAKRGYTHAIVGTVDTDVVVIAVANSNTFSYPSFGLSLMLANTRNICQRTRCSVVLAIEKSHKTSHFTPSPQVVIKRRLLPTMAEREHGKRRAH